MNKTKKKDPLHPSQLLLNDCQCFAIHPSMTVESECDEETYGNKDGEETVEDMIAKKCKEKA